MIRLILAAPLAILAFALALTGVGIPFAMVLVIIVFALVGQRRA